MTHAKPTALALSISIALAMCATAAQADEGADETDLPTVVLDTQTVTISRQSALAESHIDQAQIARTMASDSRDLVRYETGVSVVETGRMGASGFAIRGVDENRVAVTVDGLHQAQTLSSQGFKELFEGYGNFNNTRNGVEVEHLKRAIVTKGASSLVVGSGALGGMVQYQTKTPQDFLQDKDYFASHKIGYATANNERMNTTTLAGRFADLEALIIRTEREGHEFENYGYDSYDEFLQGREREKADPYTIHKESWLGKLSYAPNDEHRFTIMADTSKLSSQGHDFSYNLNASDYYDRSETSLRHTDDKSERSMFGISYENHHANALWDGLKLSYHQQKIDNVARTDDYCEGNLSCNEIANPMGWQVKDGKIVDKNGRSPTVTKVGYDTVVSIDGVPVDGAAFSLDRRLNQSWFDCSVFDCTGAITGYRAGYDDDWNPILSEKQFEFDTDNIVTDHDGKRYAKVKDAGYSDYLLTPVGQGFLERLYKQRHLKTDTKQLNVDADKYLHIGNMAHQLSYGGMYSETDTSMVNQDGSFAHLPQWWAQGFIGLRKDGKSLYDNCAEAKDTANVDRWHWRNTNTYACPSHSPLSSFLIPVTTKTGALYFADKIQVTDKLRLDLGYRYDKIKYQPNYVAGESPAIADGMVKGLFVPLPTPTHGTKPNWWDDQYQGSSDPKFIADLIAWQNAEDAYQQSVADNPAQNIAYFAQPKQYSAHSYALGATYDPTSFTRLQLKYARSFRTPTSDEMYFTFKHPNFTILPNTDLKPEIAHNKELALTLHGKLGHVTTSVFQSDYDDFLNLDYLGQKAFKNPYESNIPTLQHQLYQNVNVDKAKITGVEIDAKLNVGEVFPSLQGVNASYKFTDQKGRMAGDIPINAIQPRTSVIGIGYDHANEKFGANLYLTHVDAKKAEDTYNMFYREEGADNSQVKWRSDAYRLWDLTAYYRPTDHVTLQAGVYNLFDKKYLTWDSARSIRSFGTSNMINQTTGQGIHRFYAPERNFKLSAEFKF